MSGWSSPVFRESLEALEDPHTRRGSLAALRRTVKDVAPEVMPRLLHHVAETTVRHTSSKRYAVSLFAECARTYGQQMALHVPKVMTALVRALAAGAAAANGSSMASSGGAAAAAGGTPGGGGGRSAASLHAACADVVVEMATHCVAPPHDPAADSAAAAETQIVLAAICDPLAAELAEQHHRHVQHHHAPGAGGGGGSGAVAAGGAEHDALAGAARCLLALVQAGKWKQAS
ncbi:unnamed protein product, partial [Closterium sp. Naga37s-1]